MKSTFYALFFFVLLWSSVAQAQTTWTGTTNTDWATPTNWSTGAVPLATDDVTIPDVANDPVIMGGTAALAKSVVVQTGAILTIDATNSLTINGSINNNGVLNAIYSIGTIQNNGQITIGTSPNIGNYGILNLGIFNNNGTISIDNVNSLGLYLYGGTFTNAGDMFIGSTALSAQDCIQNNGGSLINTSTGKITLNRSSANGIWNLSGTFQNNGKINIGSIASTSTGILSTAPFTNSAGAEIHIDRVTNGIASTNTFTNAGLIRMGENTPLTGSGIFNVQGVNAVFNNNAGGDISIKQTAVSGVQNDANSTFNNNTCAKLTMFDNLNNAGTFTNGGLFIVNTTQTHTNSALTNNGTIEYPQGNPIPNVTNNDVSVVPITICGTTVTPALQIGGANSFTVGATWYTNASLSTQAGTYNQATNTFTLTNLTLSGSQTLYFSINDDVNNCSRVASIQVTIVGPIVYVTPTGAGLQNGSNWANAFSGTQVQLAINTAANCGSQVWVAKGTYYPTADASGNLAPVDPRTKTFVMKNGVAIYGGFLGNEAANYNLSLRNFVTNETILSGDIDGTPDVITGSGSTLSITGNGGNAYHVIFNNNNGLTNTAVLDGFTVSGGNANASSNPNNLGGGMLIDNVSPTITNCTFSHNYAGAGGGFYYSATSGSLTISRCIFSLNIGGNGGGVRNRANLALNNCQISENRTSGSGGGIINSPGSLSMTSCQVNGNDAASGFGGGIFSFRTLTLSFCQINNNSSGNAGGIFQGNQQLIMTNCEVKNNRTVNQGSGINLQDVPSATLTNCEISGNVSQNSQGGIANLSFSTATALLTLINCTVANNTSVGGHRAIWTTISSSGQNATTILKNTIVANNPGGNFLQADDPAMPTLFGTVQSQGNNLDSDGSSGFTNGVDGDLVNVNPLFVSATDVHLQGCSPALNVGNDAANSTTTDLDGNARKFGVIDLGAYERPSAAVAQPTASASTSTPTVCAGSIVNLQGGGGQRFSWNGPAGSNYASNAQNPSFTASATTFNGIYTVTVSNIDCPLTATNTVSVAVTPNTIVSASSNAPVCVGSQLNLFVSGGSSWTWSGPNGFSNNAQNPSRPSATAAMNGVYSVTVSTLGCTQIATTQVAINQVISPQVSSNGLLCVGTTLRLSVTGAGAGATYSWGASVPFSSTLQNPTRPNATVAMSGTYSVTVTGGCGSAVLTTSVIVSPNVAPSITALRVNNVLPNAQNTVSVCNNTQGIMLNVSATNAIEYSWRGPVGAGSGFTSSLVSPVNMPIATPRQGQYTVTVRNGCTVFNHQVINIRLTNCATRIASAEDAEAIEMEINAYPNPVSKTLTVEVRLKEAQPLQLKLLNSVGQTSGEWSLNEPSTTHRTELDLSHLTGGVYLLEAQAGQQRAVKRVVKIQYE
jgi:hypothetical protein